MPVPYSAATDAFEEYRRKRMGQGKLDNHSGESNMNVQHLSNIVGHLGAAIMQQSPSDDPIIMNHIREAYEAAKKALIIAEDRYHYHVAGTTVGKHIDECAVCGRDLRDPIHHRHSSR